MARLHHAISLSALAVAGRGVLGFTVDPFTGYVPREGFAVGVGLEQYFEVQPSRHEVAAYIRKHQDQLGRAHQYLGGWQSDSGYVLDVSRVYPAGDLGRRAAVEFGRYLGELSYADLSTGECIRL